MKNKNNETTSDIKDDNFQTFEDADHDNDWENRVLCHDGNCIGVIGPNGLCKECGKPDTKFKEMKGIKMLKCDACGAMTPVKQL